MKKVAFFILCIAVAISYAFKEKMNSSEILSYELNPKQASVKFYSKDGKGEHYKSLARLKTALEKEGKELIFAMNGGMYMMNGDPLGLYIEDGNKLKNINPFQKAYGNFYMQPNGVFYINDSKEAFVCTSKEFVENKNIKYATQSGPMLLIDGKMHPKFKEGSKNLNIRNGVGILPNGNILFAMSKEKINFYDFAAFFKKHACKNALYLDGVVSRAYLPPEDWKQMDGDFAVIIGVTK